MITLSEYLERHDAELDVISCEAPTRLTDDQFQIVMEATKHISKYQEFKPGITCHVNVIENSLSNLDQGRLYKWAFGGFREQVLLGVPAVAYSFARPRADAPLLSRAKARSLDTEPQLWIDHMTYALTDVDRYVRQNRYAFRNESSRITVAGLTDKQLDAIHEAARFVSYGTSVRPGVNCSVVKSHKSLAYYDQMNTSTVCYYGERTEMTFGDYPAVMYSYVPMYVGDSTKNLVVVDLGEYRVELM